MKGVVAGLRAFPNVNARFNDERQELEVHKSYNIGVATAARKGCSYP